MSGTEDIPSWLKKALESSDLVVVEFWAPWCSPCKIVEEELKLLSDTCPGVRIIRLDVSRDPLTAASFKVLSVPTVLVYTRRRLAARIVGIVKCDEIARVLGCSECLEAS